MVLGNETPIAGIERVVTVVTHHPVIIVFERIGRFRLAVNINLTILYFQLIMFVVDDTAFIKGYITFRQRDRGSLLRDP